MIAHKPGYVQLTVMTALAVAGGMLLSAATSPIRLLGVSSAGNTVVIEATEPVAYAVSHPDPLTVLIDLRNVSVADAANDVAAKGLVAGVTLEQATAVDGRALARVRVSLARPTQYRVRSARNTIRVELSPATAKPAAGGAPVGPAPSYAPAARTAPNATLIHGVLSSPTATGTTVTIRANGRLVPASVTETPDRPRRLVLDFPGVASRAAAETAIDSDLVGKVRIALKSREPLATRVVMDIADGATYRVERGGVNGRDVAIAVENAPVDGRVTLTPPDPSAAPVEPEPDIPIEQAIANAAAITPKDAPPIDPMSALKLVADRPAASDTPPPAPRRSAPRPAPATAQRVTATPPAAAAVPAPVTSRPVPDARVQAPSSPGPQAADATPPPPVSPAPQTPAAPPPSAPATQPPAPQMPPPSAPAPQSPAPQPPAPQPAPPAPSTGAQSVTVSQEKKFTGHPISMDFQGVDLRSVLRTFAEISGLNMVIDPDVQGTVDIVLTEVPWDQALEVILRGNGLDYTVDGTIVRIARVETLKREQDQRIQLANSNANAGTLIVRTYTLSYARAEQSAPLVRTAVLSPRGNIQIDQRTNTLIITDLPARHETVSQLLNTIDRPEPQVEVEARVVQTTREFARAVGIQWGFNGRVSPELGNTTNMAFPNRGTLGGRTGNENIPVDPRAGVLESTGTAVNLGVPGASSAVGLALGSINGAFNLDVALSALERSGKGRVLSTPRLTTQNNIEAEVAQGVQIPIQIVANNTVTVSFKEAVLLLKVTPQITSAGTVIMRITIENAAADFSRQVNGIPPIDTQRAITQVQVNDGMTTVIGGIFVSREQASDEHTPVLHRIPLLGWLFRRETQQDESRELLIFITPRILRS